MRSQYILGGLLSSGDLNDRKAAIPLLKGITSQYPNYTFKYATLDAGYDYEAIYQEVRKTKALAIIAYNR
ncbi:transposase [Paenibacillus sp. FSL H7-0357]|uniref:transposase n=1 Tax=unclassified Paenibacillus TaxID=185978 RepID=UPI0012E032D6|nr:transposase [Paenibacillus sp. FSL H7-0357]